VVKVLITGTSGRIGSYVIQPLREKYEITTFDLPGTKADYEGDMTSLEPLQNAMRGCEVVLHLAAQSDEAPFVEKLVGSNVIGIYHVLEAARLENVRRVVFTSTVQTVGMATREGLTEIETHTPPRPVSLYGVTKIMGESLGRFYHDKYGLEFIALRLGAFLSYETDWLQRRRGSNIWLSPRDTVKIFSLAIEKEDIGYAVVNATSKNQVNVLSLQSAFDVLGYVPDDKGEDYYRPRKLWNLLRDIKHKIWNRNKPH
jgi:nucleoside-diphosphate-sugar epimerase